jgi:hypothetical protein
MADGENQVGELRIEDDSAWHYAGRELSVADAAAVAENADYVRTRTQSELAWLWVLAEWCEERAQRLSQDLDRMAAA